MNIRTDNCQHLRPLGSTHKKIHCACSGQGLDLFGENLYMCTRILNCDDGGFGGAGLARSSWASY